MLPEKFQKVYNRLMDKRERKATIARVQAQSALEAIQKETDAYHDGVYDALRAVVEVQKNEQDA